MAQSGYDFFIGKANCGEERICRVCGSNCHATRNVFGPTGFVSAMAKCFNLHDEFVCPHTDEAWHDQALRLAIAINETPSKRLADLMKADIEDLLRANLK
jgi:hypothetical protein